MHTILFIAKTFLLFSPFSRKPNREEEINLIILLTLNQARQLVKIGEKKLFLLSPFYCQFFHKKECSNLQCQHTILVLPCVCENVEGSRSLAVHWIERNSTCLVNSAKLGRQGTKILVQFLINYTIYVTILVCFLCLPLDINVINCMRNPTVVSERRLDQV